MNNGVSNVVQDVDAKTVERAWAASSLQAALPTIVTELEEMTQAKLLVAFQQIASGDLTPQEALTTLIVMKAYRDLKMRIQARVKGVSHG